jgi:hypothetical protein
MSRRIDGWGDCQFPKKMHSISGCSAKELQQKQSLNKGASMRKIRRSKQFGCGRKKLWDVARQTFKPNKTKAQQNKLSGSKVIGQKLSAEKTQNF